MGGGVYTDISFLSLQNFSLLAYKKVQSTLETEKRKMRKLERVCEQQKKDLQLKNRTLDNQQFMIRSLLRNNLSQLCTQHFCKKIRLLFKP